MVFDMQYLHNDKSDQTGFSRRFKIAHALQLSIYFDYLGCLQEILVFEFYGLNCSMNSKISALINSYT